MIMSSYCRTLLVVLPHLFSPLDRLSGLQASRFERGAECYIQDVCAFFYDGNGNT